MTVDRIVLGAVVALLAATCLLAVAPGIVAQESLVAQGSGRALPFYLLVVMPFLIGAIATGARAFFGKQGIPAAVACGLGIVAVLCFARVLAVTSDSLWPGFPSPYGQGWGAGAWLALALVAVCVVAAHWERPTRATFGGFAALLATLPFLAACHWDNEASTASALAWASGLAALAVSLLWSCRGAIGRVSQQLGWMSPDAPAWRDARAVRDALVASTGFTLLAIVAGNMVTLLGRGLETVGPFEGSFFAGSERPRRTPFRSSCWLVRLSFTPSPSGKPCGACRPRFWHSAPGASSPAMRWHAPCTRRIWRTLCGSCSKWDSRPRWPPSAGWRSTGLRGRAGAKRCSPRMSRGSILASQFSSSWPRSLRPA